MVEIFESLSRQKRVVAVARDISDDRLLTWQAAAGMHDPHIWFDVRLWQEAVRHGPYVEFDPPHAADYDRRAADYLAELDRLDKYCHDQADELTRRAR
jgi:manganese/zinc/iron transport system substrate-binding protein